jgi:pimeloyl-ACP methyl ester carboxylesterase
MAQSARSDGARPVATAMLPALLSEETRRNAPTVTSRVQDMMHGTSPETLIAALAGMAARRDMTAALPDIAVPTLILVGEDDAITPAAGARRMAMAIPNATFQEIAGAGHLSNLERPDVFSHALAEFLGRL